MPNSIIIYKKYFTFQDVEQIINYIKECRKRTLTIHFKNKSYYYGFSDSLKEAFENDEENESISISNHHIDIMISRDKIFILVLQKDDITGEAFDKIIEYVNNKPEKEKKVNVLFEIIRLTISLIFLAGLAAFFIINIKEFFTVLQENKTSYKFALYFMTLIATLPIFVTMLTLSISNLQKKVKKS